MNHGLKKDKFRHKVACDLPKLIYDELVSRKYFLRESQIEQINKYYTQMGEKRLPEFSQEMDQEMSDKLKRSGGVYSEYLDKV